MAIYTYERKLNKSGVRHTSRTAAVFLQGIFLMKHDKDIFVGCLSHDR